MVMDVVTGITTRRFSESGRRSACSPFAKLAIAAPIVRPYLPMPHRSCDTRRRTLRADTGTLLIAFVLLPLSLSLVLLLGGQGLFCHLRACEKEAPTGG
jgi:hypothetical protein